MNDTLTDWFDTAQALADAIRKAEWWRLTRPNNSFGVPDKTPEEDVMRWMREADADVNAWAESILLEVEAMETQAVALSKRFCEVQKHLEFAYAELLDFEPPNMPVATFAWPTLFELVWKVANWGREISTARQKASSIHFITWNERESFLRQVIPAIKNRLLLEHSQIQRDSSAYSIRSAVTPTGDTEVGEKSTKASGGGARRRRRKAGEQKLTSQGLLVVSGLCTWHEIQANGKDVLFNKQKPAIGCREAQREFGIPFATVSEQFKKIFGSHKAYSQNWKRNPKGLAYQLATLNGEVFCLGADVAESESEPED